ncbi:MAG: DNA polymerase IV [Clostridia bacterium]|nr:DNA polymerase IV [Clostridia bacterium]
MDRVILHCDLNNFYASVECAINPILWTKPVAVTGNPRTRHGIILAKNQVAKNLGIKTAQTIWEAKLLCPNLICLPPQFELYQQYSRKVRDIYLRFTDQVESFGPDECWLDVTHSTNLFGSGEEIANKLRKLVKEETGLTISIGVSFNKYFAKLGSDLKKPDATTIISKENFKQKIWDLPADSLIFIGNKTIKKLNKFNIHTIGDLAKASEKLLKQQFGILGIQYKQVANGEDTSIVNHQDNLDKAKSVGNGMTAIRDLHTRDEIETMIYTLAEKVTFRMREAGYVGRTANLTLRNSDLSKSRHSITKLTATDNALEFAEMCIEIFNTFWQGITEFSVRSVRISMSNLEYKSETQQITFFDTPKKIKEQKLNKSLDEIRQKYGYYAVRRAKTIDKDFINYYEVDEEENS